MGKGRFSVLEKDEARRIHEASLSVLSTVGLKVNSDLAQNLLRAAGC